MSEDRPEYSVWLFFPDGSYVGEDRWISAHDAVLLAKRCSERPAALAGFVQRIIITDGADNTCFEWVYGKGVTYPPRAE